MKIKDREHLHIHAKIYSFQIQNKCVWAGGCLSNAKLAA